MLTLRKIYRSQAFVDKIEESVANISASPDDEFKLVKAFYDYNEFNCELCDHKHCVYAFLIENIQTKIKMKVGSECIHHFKDKGVDLDLAEALMKRIIKATHQARVELRNELAQAAWNNLPEKQKKISYWEKREFMEDLAKQEMKKLSKTEKREMMINAYMRIQAKELLIDVAMNKSILSEEQISEIIDLGLEDKLLEAQKTAELQKKRDKAFEIEKNFRDHISTLKLDSYKDINLLYVEKIAKRWKEIYPQDTYYNPIAQDANEYQSKVKKYKKYSWLINYSGSKYIVKDIREKLLRYNTISEKQESYAKSLIAAETKSKTSADLIFDKQIEAVLDLNTTNSYVVSVYNYYKRNGFVSEKQKNSIIKIFNKIHT